MDHDTLEKAKAERRLKEFQRLGISCCCYLCGKSFGLKRVNDLLETTLFLSAILSIVALSIILDGHIKVATTYVVIRL